MQAEYQVRARSEFDDFSSSFMAATNLPEFVASWFPVRASRSLVPTRGNKGQPVATRSDADPQGEVTDGLPAQSLAEDLLRTHGHVVGGEALYRLLGYGSADAFQQALRREAVGVPVFALPGRRGKFAMTRDVSAFLLRHREQAIDHNQGGQTITKKS